MRRDWLEDLHKDVAAATGEPWFTGQGSSNIVPYYLTGMMMVPFDNIEVGVIENHRTDMGDLAGLTKSIEEEGLLQPLVVQYKRHGVLRGNRCGRNVRGVERDAGRRAGRGHRPRGDGRRRRHRYGGLQLAERRVGGAVHRVR